MSYRRTAASIADELIAFRRDMHRDPEIGLQLPRTQERVLNALDGLGLEISTGQSTSSVTAVLRGGAPHSSADTSTDRQAKAVLLRADMDALPVQEQTGVDFTSRVDQAMHACGHDLHTAMLVGAARMLADAKASLAGDVVFMFQPGEEGYHGARYMIEEGVLDAAGPRVSAAYGMHVFSAMAPQPTLMTRRGPMLAASDDLRITVHGRGGHGSAPYRAKDPVPVLAEIVTALQAAATRFFNVFDPVIITVGYLRAGSAPNVIPDDAELWATVRSFSAETHEKLIDRLPSLARSIAEAHRMEAEVDYQVGYPVTSNDADVTAWTEDLIEETFDDGRRQTMADPLTGSEDFSYVLNEVPGTFVGLSAVPPELDPQTSDYNHSPRATFDDAVLADGAALYATWADRQLSELAG